MRERSSPARSDSIESSGRRIQGVSSVFANSIDRRTGNRQSEEAIIQIAEPNEMGGLGHIFARFQKVETVLGGGVHFSLISGYNVDKAFRQSQFVVKLGIPDCALNPGDLGISTNPKSSIPIFASCFKAGVRQTAADREASDQVTLLVEQIDTAILDQDGQILVQDPFGLEYHRTF